MKCPGCGEELEGLGTFCWTCGDYVSELGGQPAPTRAPDVIPDVIPDDRLEDEIQEAGRKALELLGFTVYSLSQDRATRQTPGIADTYVAGHGRTTWAEWKKWNGIQKADQIAFEQVVTANGDEYHVWRHESEAIGWAEGVISTKALNRRRVPYDMR